MAVKVGNTTVIDNSGNLVNGATITGTTFVGVFATGTPMLFAQTAAPTGWTKQTATTYNDKALRVVNGTVGSGGSNAFSTVFASRGVSGTVGGTSLSTTTMPSHGHMIYANSFAGNLAIEVGAGSGDGSNYGHNDIGFDASQNDTEVGYYNGSGSAHGHGFTGTAINFAVQYVDCIYATKD